MFFLFFNYLYYIFFTYRYSLLRTTIAPRKAQTTAAGSEAAAADGGSRHVVSRVPSMFFLFFNYLYYIYLFTDTFSTHHSYHHCTKESPNDCSKEQRTTQGKETTQGLRRGMFFFSILLFVIVLTFTLTPNDNKRGSRRVCVLSLWYVLFLFLLILYQISIVILGSFIWYHSVLLS